MNSLRLPALPLLLVCFFAVASSPAAEPPSAPVLRIEAGMHTAQINRISADAAGRLALTVSDDKTARLWDLPSGRLLRVLRPPLGDGDEGKLYAVALSPDGNLAAVGGFTGADGSGNYSIYLFETATGRMMRRIEGLPTVVTDLAFSAQGRFLAAVLGGGNGLRVWETATGREMGQHTDYGERDSYGVDWHGEDRLVTTCLDGNLRIYRWETSSAPDASDGKLTLLKRSTVKGGKMPFSARFSPDGRRIAVGFYDSNAVTVVDGDDLSFLFAPDTTGVTNGNLGRVTWTEEGATLAAGGTSGLYDRRIRQWPKAGRGEPRDSAAAVNNVMDLRPLSGGRVLFGAASPAWGVLKPTGEIQILGTPPVADYEDSNPGSHFQLASDGTVVAFGYENVGKITAQFSLPERQLTVLKNQIAQTGLQPPRIKGLKVTDWVDNTAPKLDGQPLKLDRGEISRSLAIARDASTFLLGMDWSLRSFTAKGKERWRMPTPSAAWAVNLADGDQLAVAAYGDGTIRWRRVDNGQELLAFYPHADRKRWVLWATEYRAAGMLGAVLEKSPDGKVIIKTLVADGPAERAALTTGDELLEIEGEKVTEVRPAVDLIRSHLPGASIRISIRRGSTEIEKNATLGASPTSGPAKAVYYDCSPGAEDLIGWQVNRGKDQAADFFPASRFRNLFYRPDVISRVLQTRDAAEALRQANRELGLPEAKAEDISEIITRLAPPVVELETGGVFGKVTLPTEAAKVSIRYRVRQTGAEPSTKVTVRFNGRLLDISAPLPKSGDIAEVIAPIPPEMAGELTVLAEHRLAVSEAAVLRIEREGPAHPRQPDLYVVSVGVAKFKMNEGNPIRKAGELFLRDLEHASDDARRIGKTFEAQSGILYHRVILQTLTDREVTAPLLRQTLRNVAKQARPGDVAVFFFSGHGVVDPKAGFYLATYEANLKNPAGTTLTGKELSTLLEGIKARTVLALDTCHSGGAFGGARLAKVITSPNDLTGLVNELSSAEQGTVVMSSSGASQESLEDPKKGGLFTVALCEGLESRSAAAKGIEPGGATVSCAGLRDWLSNRVPELVAALVSGAPNAPQQTPACVIPKGVPDFPIAVKR